MAFFVVDLAAFFVLPVSAAWVVVEVRVSARLSTSARRVWIAVLVASKALEDNCNPL